MSYYQWRVFARDVTVCCVGSMAMGLGLAMLADMAIPKKAQARPSELRLIERTVERAAGTRVLWAKGRTHGCNKSTLLGFYAPDKNTVIMCEANLRNSLPMAIELIKHEGWHAIQFRCNQGKPVLRDDQLRNGMRRKDKAILREAYPQHQHRLEAEARTVSQLPTQHFLAGVEAYCRYRT